MSFATRRGEVTATMAPSNLGYSIKEANRHFFRNWTTSLGAVITIFLSLFIIGLFIVGSAMVNAHSSAPFAGPPLSPAITISKSS